MKRLILVLAMSTLPLAAHTQQVAATLTLSCSGTYAFGNSNPVPSAALGAELEKLGARQGESAGPLLHLASMTTRRRCPGVHPASRRARHEDAGKDYAVIAIR
jgi:hypothetical protein